MILNFLAAILGSVIGLSISQVFEEPLWKKTALKSCKYDINFLKIQCSLLEKQVKKLEEELISIRSHLDD